LPSSVGVSQAFAETSARQDPRTAAALLTRIPPGDGAPVFPDQAEHVGLASRTAIKSDIAP
jgi:hypothetical protein